MDPFIGEIGKFAPRDLAMRNGQQLAIAQNTPLSSLLGTTYGGNGQTAFYLPDLRSRAPMHFGQGSGLTSYSLGEVAGTETVKLLATQMPTHTHALACASSPTLTSTPDPARKYIANTGPTNSYAATADSMAAALSPAGGRQPYENRHPFLCLNFISGRGFPRQKLNRKNSTG